MIETNVRNFCNNFNAMVKEEAGWIKTGFKSTTPCLLAAVMFKGLQEQAKLQPVDTVVYTACKFCEATQWILTVAAAINLFYQWNKLEENVKKKQIEQKEISDIVYLKQENSRLTEENLKLIRQLEESHRNTNLNDEYLKNDY